MALKSKYDAVVVGAGPNGLAAAITLARSGRSVLLREAAEVAGGGLRTHELTVPGFVHDLFSSVHPLAVVSPFFRSLPLEKHGLKWIYPPAAVVQTLENGKAVALWSSLEKTSEGLGEDGAAYRALFQPFLNNWEELFAEVFQPVTKIPRHPFLLARFGLHAIQSAAHAISKFRTPEARALLAGVAAHSSVPLTWAGSLSIGLALSLAGHAKGWPFPEGGAARLAAALVSYFQSLGGEIELSAPVASLEELPYSDLIFLDLTPRQIARIAGPSLPGSYLSRLQRFRYGPGVFKMDFALSSPIPWLARECTRSATVHVSSNFEEMIESEEAPMRGQCYERPFVLLTQPSLFDPTRAPAGKHVAWAYCHVPQGVNTDVSELIVSQIERFAPGFRNLILGRSSLAPADLEKINPNLVGGDIAGGLAGLRQIVFRPFAKINPYSTPNSKIWICSSSTPPGPGVHGMCGYNAALNIIK